MTEKLPSEGMPFSRDEQDETVARALISAYKAGDQDAFTELVRRYRSQVAALAYRVVDDYDEAADIAQNVFVKLAHTVHRYDESKKFYTWLYRITVNAAIDHLRKHKRHKHESIEDYHEILESEESNPEVIYRRQLLAAYIEEATSHLTDKQRSAFILRDVEGCQVTDVAETMKMPEATVRWYLHRARSRIRQELLRQCRQLLVTFGVK